MDKVVPPKLIVIEARATTMVELGQRLGWKACEKLLK
jgi:hypothetical protein